MAYMIHAARERSSQSHTILSPFLPATAAHLLTECGRRRALSAALSHAPPPWDDDWNSFSHPRPMLSLITGLLLPAASREP